MLEDKYIYINKYEKLEYIGEDGSGKFFKIRDKKSGNFYQAKISFKEKSAKMHEHNVDIKEEFNIMSKIQYPPILKFFGYSPKNFKGQNKSVIVTEYAKNGSLFNIIRLEKQGKAPFCWNDTKKLICLYGIAAGMSYLHSNYIIHRDLRSLNVHLDEKFYPKIADFEFSKINIQQSQNYIIHTKGELKGAHNYISPEIWTEYKYSSSSDVYAYGMLIYEIFTQEIPFDGIPYYQIMQKVTQNERPKYDNSIPNAYQELMKLCWSQNAQDRPTFDYIRSQLRTDSCFITNNINKLEVQNYIKYLDDCEITCDDKEIYGSKISKNLTIAQKKLNSSNISVMFRNVR